MNLAPDVQNGDTWKEQKVKFNLNGFNVKKDISRSDYERVYLQIKKCTIINIQQTPFQKRFYHQKNYLRIG